jgi:hypothetical protein
MKLLCSKKLHANGQYWIYFKVVGANVVSFTSYSTDAHVFDQFEEGKIYTIS